MNLVAFRRMTILSLSLLFSVLLTIAFSFFVMKGETYNRFEAAQQLSLEAVETALPYHIPGTPLVVEAFVSYEGEYFEDLSFDMVCNVAALVVRNMSSKSVSISEICISGEFGEYKFLLKYLPAYESAMIIERSRKNYMVEKFSSINATVCYEDQNWKSKFSVANCNETTIAVTNMSKEYIAEAWVHYKMQYPDADLYMQGNAFSACTGALRPGETVYLELRNYSRTCSKIVCVESK